MAHDWSGRVFSTDLVAFQDDFRFRSIRLGHKLDRHPLFTPERLTLAAERAVSADGGTYFHASAGLTRLDSRFDETNALRPFPELIANLRYLSAWAKLSSLDSFDSDYADFLSDAISDLSELTGQPKSAMSEKHITVFMASPNVSTPFHIDHDFNILAQIIGSEKRLCVFPPNDRDLVTQEEVEGFYVTDMSAAKYKPHLQTRGNLYPMEPGMAVSIPPLGPHWVQNGNDVSISLSLVMSLPEFDRRAKIHQVNYHLRKAGFRPAEPGAGSFDNAKANFLTMLSIRKPMNQRELLFSGVDRLRLPARVLRGIGRHWRALSARN